MPKPVHLLLAVLAVLATAAAVAGCGSTTSPSGTAAGSTTSAPPDSATVLLPDPGTVPPGTPDPCALADPAQVQAALGSIPAKPKADAAMSGDGRGPVLNCTYLAADQKAGVIYTQRLAMGRTLYDDARDKTPGSIVRTGPEGYWEPKVPRILTLDGEDLVAITFHNLHPNFALAQSMLNNAIARRHGVVVGPVSR